LGDFLFQFQFTCLGFFPRNKRGMKLKKAYVESSMATVNKKDPSRNTKAISFMDMSQTSEERILDTGERTFVTLGVLDPISHCFSYEISSWNKE